MICYANRVAADAIGLFFEEAECISDFKSSKSAKAKGTIKSAGALIAGDGVIRAVSFAIDVLQNAKCPSPDRVGLKKN